MVALLRHQPISARSAEPRVRHLRLVGSTESAGHEPELIERRLPSGGMPRVGVAPVAGSDALSWPSPVVLVAVALVVFGLLGATRLAQGGPGEVAGSADTVAARVADGRGVVATPLTEGDLLVTVGPGDTLWAIAVAAAPDRDPRPLVTALAEANGGPSLQIGQQIVIPGHLLD